MNISLQFKEGPDALAAVRAACIAVGVFEDGSLTREAAALDGAGALRAAVAARDISGKPGSSLLLRGVPGTEAERVLLVGLGKEPAPAPAVFLNAVRTALRAFRQASGVDAILALPLDRVADRDASWAIRQAALVAHEVAYRRDRLKSEPAAQPEGIANLVLWHAPSAGARAALAEACATGQGSLLARELGDLPPNVCTPTYLANRACALAEEFGFGVDILGRAALAELKMHAYLAVADGSDAAPAFIVLRHRGGTPDHAPVVLVGKGLTFDSGGISIKPGAAMDEMKYDMAGAASVLGVFRAIGEMQLGVNVIGIVAACENMPSGRSVRPGDIVTSMNGLTIEVLNTDAEGRLVLCDALTYAERFEPAAVVDIATLTGACVVALGHHNSGLFTRGDAAHERLAAQLLAAGDEAADPAWRLPLQEPYFEQLKSEFADLANIGSPGGGASVAAAFLEKFTRTYTWAHLDIAGTAWKSGSDKGATGRPVPLLTRWLRNLENNT
jgi:leucyl aminopeptidase